MEDLKNRLSSKGAKWNFELTRKEQEYLLAECGFTDEEVEIFKLRCRGKSILQTSFEMEDRHRDELPNGIYSCKRVETKIRAIKKKILKVLQTDGK